jgi:CHAT domain
VARAVVGKRRAAETPSQEARLEIGPTTISLRVEPGADGIEAVRPVEVEARTPQIDENRWAGDAAAFYAQAQGRILWANVFSGALGLALTHAAKSAEAAGQALTLRVVPGPDIPPDRVWLPWELLVNPAVGSFQALSSGWSIVRGTAPNAAARPLPAGRPLRITAATMLSFGEAPDDWRSAFVHAADEAARLRELAADGTGRVEVTVVDDADRTTLLELLRTTDADVLHLIGARSGGPRSHVTTSDELAGALAENAGVALIVLNGCDMGTTAEEVNRTTGATVLAHRSGVSDLHAARLTETFYPPLLDGLPADLAISEARRQLELQFPGQAPWASTVLFTGWPPARYEPAAAAVDPGSVSFDGPSFEPAPPAASAADLVRLLHETNLSKLQAMSHQEWAPIAAQVATAGAERGTP